MKKITLLIALFCSISAFSTRYLVQGPGTNTWRTAGLGEVNVTMTTFSSWIAGVGTYVSGDEIWLAGGTYTLDVTWGWIANVSIYGSFAGTETAINQRTMGISGNPWDFANQTVLDLNHVLNIHGITTVDNTIPTYFDGLEIINMNCNGATAVDGVISVKKLGTVQNCIIANNSFVGSSALLCRTAGVFVQGGNLTNSHIYNNSSLQGTGSNKTATGGGVCLCPYLASQISGCTIEGNTATSSGGAIFIYEWVLPEVVNINNCIIKNNSTIDARATGGGAIGGSFGYSANAANSFSVTNTQFINNTNVSGDTGTWGGGALMINAQFLPVSIVGCTFMGNVTTCPGGDPTLGGGAIFIYEGNDYSGAPPVNIANCVFAGNKATNANAGAILSYYNTKITNCIFTNNSNGSVDMSTVSLQGNNCEVDNCTFANNSTSGVGAAIDLYGSAAGSLTNCIFWGNSKDIYNIGTVAITYNAYDTDQSASAFFGVGSINTLTVSNTFVSPTTFLGFPSSPAQVTQLAFASWKLQPTCPAVNAGTTLAAVTSDILGIARPQGSAYDMGAYETTYGTTTAIRNFEKSTIQCYSSNQTIIVQGVEAGEIVNVYGVAGNLISSKKASNSNMLIALSKGIYLVRIADNVTKVFVK